MNRTTSRHLTAVRRRHLDRFSPQMMDSVIESAETEHIQLGRGEFSGDVLRVLSDDKVLDSGIYSKSILGYAGMPQERVSLGFVVPAQNGGILEACKLESPTLFLYTEGAELDCRLEPGTRWLVFQVPRKQLEACGLTVPTACSGPLRWASAQCGGLINEGLRILNDLNVSSDTDSDACASGAEDHFDGLLAAFASAFSPESLGLCSKSSSRQRQLIRTIQDYVDAHLAEKLRVIDLCTISGVSYKTLERAFLVVLGVTPRQYISVCRLSRARRLMLNAHTKHARVGEIALACGYDQLGRFSRDYRCWFGEKPSDTLRRSP